MSSDLAIDAQQLTKVYRKRWSGDSFTAVDGVNIQVPRGTTYGLLGPNGAGKTTFVKMILSSVHPTGGRAEIFGIRSSEPEARRPIGYLPENHRFPTYFTGAGMLDFYGALSGLPSPERKRRVPELLEQVGIGKWANTRLSKYSKGMLQRVGLAQALIHKPQLLILDEPSDGVDPVGRKEIRDILHALEQQGVTVFINSHLLVEVELFCREVAILHKGRVARTGSVRELTAGKGYRLTTPASIPDVLRDSLKASSMAASSRDGVVDFQFSTRESVNAAVDVVRAAGCEVEAVVPTTSTLEEVFIKTVEGK